MSANNVNRVNFDYILQIQCKEIKILKPEKNHASSESDPPQLLVSKYTVVFVV